MISFANLLQIVLVLVVVVVVLVLDVLISHEASGANRQPDLCRQTTTTTMTPHVCSISGEPNECSSLARAT